MEVVTEDANTAMLDLIDRFTSPEHGDKVSMSTSRNGAVKVVEEPVMVIYQRPEQRVLLNEARDANPFFHMFEAFWMLAGRQDVSSLTLFNSRMKEYSDDGKVFNAAYGYRWRNHFPVDQIPALIRHIENVPHTRRAVLSMWDPHIDFISDKLDIPCNMNITFNRVGYRLDMTVFNRSNDLIWGMLGANYVHMGFLHEVISSCLGLNQGVYTQCTANLHLYGRFFPEIGKYKSAQRLYSSLKSTVTVPLIEKDVPGMPEDVWDRFQADCAAFVDHTIKDMEDTRAQKEIAYSHRFFNDVASPMIQVYKAHRERQYLKAFSLLGNIKAADWKEACRLWINKRHANWNAR